MSQLSNYTCYLNCLGHSFANSSFKDQKFVTAALLSTIEYECALKNSSNHRVVMLKKLLQITSDLQRVFKHGSNAILQKIFAKLFNDGGLTTIAM